MAGNCTYERPKLSSDPRLLGRVQHTPDGGHSMAPPTELGTIPIARARYAKENTLKDTTTKFSSNKQRAAF